MTNWFTHRFVNYSLPLKEFEELLLPNFLQIPRYDYVDVYSVMLAGLSFFLSFLSTSAVSSSPVVLLPPFSSVP